jgi:hypothetical protein
MAAVALPAALATGELSSGSCGGRIRTSWAQALNNSDAAARIASLPFMIASRW